jgi:hypothetical protein
MMKKRIVFLNLLLFVTVAATSPTVAQNPSYHAATSMAAIPPEVLSALTGLCGGCSFADFNAPWNWSDVINDLPQRRFVKAGYVDSK